MRGKVQIQLHGLVLHGITPAYAGKRQDGHDPNRKRRDHPRVCGEKNGEICKLHGVRGSPPRMRGKVLLQLGKLRIDGITPAYAGKRRLPYRRCRSRQDHPRVCGEKAFAI